MDFLQITSFSLIALLLVVFPEANGLLIVKTVASSGKKVIILALIFFIKSSF